jgi:hypothetical protein
MTTSVPSCRPWRTCRTGASRSRSVCAKWLPTQSRREEGAAYDPIWSFSKGSSISFRLANNRTARDRSRQRTLSAHYHVLPDSPHPHISALTSKEGKKLTISRDFMSSRSQARHRTQDIAVDLPRVSLPRDGVSERETEELRHSLVERLDLVVVAVEEGEEGSLGSGRALDASEAEVLLGSGEVSEIPEKFLHAVGRNTGRRRALSVLFSELDNRGRRRRGRWREADKGRVRLTWSQRVALFPTVVSWAGWKWVKPRVGRALYCSAKSASREMTMASLSRRRVRPSRRKIRSALLFIVRTVNKAKWEGKQFRSSSEGKNVRKGPLTR